MTPVEKDEVLIVIPADPADPNRPLTAEEAKKVEDAGTLVVYQRLKALGLSPAGRVVTVRVFTLPATQCLADEAHAIRNLGWRLKAEMEALADTVMREGTPGERVNLYPTDGPES